MRTIRGMHVDSEIVISPLRMGRVNVKIKGKEIKRPPQELEITLESEAVTQLILALEAANKWAWVTD